jgi:hypothetical protein
MATKTPQTASATSTDVAPSINWWRAMASGPDARIKITEGYARLVARTAYFWDGRWSISTTAGWYSISVPSRA